MPVKYKDFTTFMKEMGTLNAYTPGATTTGSNSNSGSSSKKTTSSGATTKGVGEASYFNAFSGALNDKISLENKKVDNAYSIAQGQLGLEKDRLSSGNALEKAKLALSRTQSAAQIEATNKANFNAFTMANKELAQRRREAAANAANNRAQVGVQGAKVAADKQVGLAEIGAKRYGIDAEKQIAKMTDSTNRFKIGKDFDLGKLTLASNERIKSADRLVQERTGRNSNMTSLIANRGV